MRFTRVIPVAAAVTVVAANYLPQGGNDPEYDSWDKDVPSSSSVYEDVVTVKTTKVIAKTVAKIDEPASTWAVYEDSYPSNSPPTYSPIASSSQPQWASSYAGASSTPVSPVITSASPAGYWGASYPGALSSSTPVSPVLPSSSSWAAETAYWYRRDYMNSASSEPTWGEESSNDPEAGGHLKTPTSASMTPMAYAYEPFSSNAASSSPISNWAQADALATRPSSPATMSWENGVKYSTDDDDDYDGSYDDEDYDDSWTSTEKASTSYAPAYTGYYRRSAGYYEPAQASSFVTSYTKVAGAELQSSSMGVGYSMPKYVSPGSSSGIPSNSIEAAAVLQSSSNVWKASYTPSGGYPAPTAAVYMGGPLGYGAASPTGSYSAPISKNGLK
jgi:hypothetical protein